MAGVVARGTQTGPAPSTELPTRFLLIANPRSGTADARELERRARDRLHDVETLWLEPGTELGPVIDRATEDGRALVSVGGDGTVNAVAQHLAGTDGVMGVLPGGTLNHFARDLGVGDPDAAIDALEKGRVARIDAARSSDRFFVNNAGLGLYPELVYERERHEHRVGKLRAAVAAAREILGTVEPVVGTITADGDPKALLAWAVFVGNNRFGTQTGRIGSRERIDQGILDLRLLTVGRRRASQTKFAWRVLRSRQWRGRRLVQRTARRVEIHLIGDPRLVSWDGENGGPVSDVSFEIVPGAIRAIVPDRGNEPGPGSVPVR
jgi:diacylglycerol kinase family enzyme